MMMNNLKNAIQHTLKYAIVFALALLPVFAFSAEYSLYNYLQRTNFQVGKSVSLSDPRGLEELMDVTNLNVSRDCNVRLVYDRNTHSDITTQNFGLKISYYVIFTQNDGSTQTESGTLSVNYGGNPIVESVNSYNQVAPNAKLVITQVCYTNSGGEYNCAGPLPNSIPSDIKLVVEYDTDRFVEMQEFKSIPQMDATFMHVTTSSSNDIQISWKYIEGAESYDLEWMYIDSKDDVLTSYDGGNASLNNNPFVNEPKDNFRQPVRINTTDQHYILDNTFNQGILFFRVRGVGRFVNQAQGACCFDRQGSWCYDISSGIVSGILSPVNVSQFQQSKTWQYQKSYVEDGKNKKVITYYDETNRGRQVLTNVSSNNTTVIAETKYDYEGRPVVNILPTPVQGNNINYRSYFNTYAVLNTFSKEEFDRSATTTPPLSIHNGAGKYYSSFTSSPVAFGINQEYTPISEGFAYTQVKYLRDNTGRVERQSGVSDKHKLLGGHDTRYYYSRANETELERLFGSNVGIAVHHEKVAIQDPNGQMSVAYKDQEGRVVATALVGKSPDNLLELDYNDPAAIQVDLTENNNYDASNNSYTLDYAVLNTKEGNEYKFYYDLKPLLIDDEGIPGDETSKNICYQCKYTLRIDVMDPDGFAVPLTQYTTYPGSFPAGANVTGHANFATVGTVTDLFDPTSVACSTNVLGYAATAKNLGFHATFTKVGTYKIVKQLTIALPEVSSALVSQWVAEGEIPSLADIINQEENKIDVSICDLTCEDRCKRQYPGQDPTSLLNCRNCINTCIQNAAMGAADSINRDECDGLKAEMMRQMSPGGLYYDIWVTDWDNAESEDNFYENHQEQASIAESILKGAMNPLGDAEGGSTNDIHVFYDFPLNTLPVPFSDIKDPSKFDEDWAEQLLQFHPEHCHLKFCGEPEETHGLYPSRMFDKEMALLQSWSQGITDYGSPNPHPENFDPIFDAYDPSHVGDGQYHIDNGEVGGCTFTRSELITAMANVRYLAHNSGVYTNVTVTIYQYVDPNNSLGTSPVAGHLNNPLYQDLSPNDANGIALRRWQLFRGKYLDLKRQLIRSELVECYCGSNSNATYDFPPLVNGYLIDGDGKKQTWAVVEPIANSDQMTTDVASSANANSGNIYAWQNDVALPMVIDECKASCDGATEEWFSDFETVGEYPLKDELAINPYQSCMLAVDLAVKYDLGDDEVVAANINAIKNDFKNYCIAKCTTITTTNNVVIPPVINNSDITSANFPTINSLGLLNCLKPNLSCEDRLSYWLTQIIKNCPDITEPGQEDLYVGAHSLSISINGTSYNVNNDIAALTQALSLICSNISNVFNDNIVLNDETVIRLKTSGNNTLIHSIELVEDIIDAHGCGNSVPALVTEEFDKNCMPSQCLTKLVQAFNLSASTIIKRTTTIELPAGSPFLRNNCNASYSSPTVNVSAFVEPTTGIMRPVVKLSWSTIAPALDNYGSYITTTFTNDGVFTVVTTPNNVSYSRRGSSTGTEIDTVYSNPPNKRFRTSGSVPIDPTADMDTACDVLSFFDACGHQIVLSHIASIGTPYFDDAPPAAAGLQSGYMDDMQYVQVAANATLISSAVANYCQVDDDDKVTIYFYKPRNADCPFEYTVCNEPSVEEWKDDCIDFLYNQAHYNATKIWDKIVEEKTTSFLTNYVKSCGKSKERFKMEYELNEYHYTLYYYDQSGKLVQTVPPEGVDVLGQQDWAGQIVSNELISLGHLVNDVGIVPNDQPKHRLITRYQYNALGQVIWQSTPDGGESRFWYNKKGQLRLSQNAVQAIASQPTDRKYSFTSYDNLGRITVVGEVSDVSDPQASADNPLFPRTALPPGSLATNELADLTYTTYDAPAGSNCLGSQSFLRGRVSSVETYNGVSQFAQGTQLDATKTSSTAYSYDIHGNVNKLSQTISGMDLNGDGSSDCKLVNYSYDLLSGKVNEVMYQDGESDMFRHKYEYDADNRLTNVYTSKDNLIWDEDANYFYYPHGPLARTEIGEDQVQAMDYYYTIHGWLKGVNMPNTDDALGRDGIAAVANGNKYFAKDEYKFTIGYYSTDYTAVGAAGTAPISMAIAPAIAWGGLNNGMPDGNGLYNGNISWIIGDIPEVNRQYGSEPAMQAMIYKYDQLNRIKMSGAFNFNSSNWSMRGDGSYATSYHFDKNGNITDLTRTGGMGVYMDALHYTYDIANHNRLLHVNDGVSAGAVAGIDVDDQGTYSPGNGNYGYDAIGNLTRDNAEHIQDIDWNVYGKIRQITPTSGSGKDKLEFTYDGMGNRITKKVSALVVNNPTQEQNTYYVRDASGNVMATYNRTFVNLNPPMASPAYVPVTTTEYPIYGSSRLGIYETAKGPLSLSPTLEAEIGQHYRTLGKKQYELTDHLGNVTATISDKKRGIASGNGVFHHYEASVTSFNDYYPYGMPMPNRTYSSPSYRYGYNGKEKDDEVKGSSNSLDFGARVYDPRLGKFLSIDPDAEQYPMWSPYCYAGNKPIAFIDENGQGIASGFVGFAVDAGMQFVIGLVMYDGNAEMAFKNIDWTQAGISGVQSALPWTPPGGKYGRAAFDAASDVVINAVRGKYDGLSGDEYKWAVIKDFAMGAVTSLGSQVLVDKLKVWLGKHKTFTKTAAVTAPTNTAKVKAAASTTPQAAHTKTQTKVEQPWQKTEQYVAAQVPNGKTQQAFKDGAPTPNNRRVKGSSVPDIVDESAMIAYEQKNYAKTLASGNYNPLINKITSQFELRVKNLPAGYTQIFDIDMTEHMISKEAQTEIREAIISKVSDVSKITIRFITRK